jgi:transcriptional regulator with XRE-family HTH domain
VESAWNVGPSWNMRRHPQLVALGARIREVRKSRGYAQEQFANEVGLDRSYYGGIERGERNVAALNLIKIARALSVEVGELFPSMPKARLRG